MKTYLKYLLIALVLTSCSADEGPGYNYDLGSTIFSDNTSTEFEEIILLLNLKTQDTLYPWIVVEKIENIKLKVNDRLWGNFQSTEINTSEIQNTHQYHNLLLTDRKISYLCIAGYAPEEIETYTAGDFADYLSEYMSLAPGDYICEIAEVSFLNQSGDTIKIHPLIYQDFIVETETKSCYLGEFEINIYDF